MTTQAYADRLADMRKHAFYFGLCTHGIELEYQPIGGGAVQSIRGQLKEIARQETDGGTVEVRTEYALAVSKDPDATRGEIALGGITHPRNGDRVRRSGGAWLVFEGNHERRSPHSWHLILRGFEASRIGTEQTRG